MLLATAAVIYGAGGPPILRRPTAPQLAALAYLTIAITALVFILGYRAAFAGSDREFPGLLSDRHVTEATQSLFAGEAAHQAVRE